MKIHFPHLYDNLFMQLNALKFNHHASDPLTYIQKQPTQMA